MAEIEEWMPEIDPRAIDDLRARLRGARWPAPPPRDGDLGVAHSALPSRRTEIDGMAIHFLHARAVASPTGARRPIPLLLLHGWPDSAWRHRRVIATLSDPARFGAYAAMHRTKADTVAVALTDSPAGLAAWIVEKIEAWSDVGDDSDGLWSVYHRDDVLQLLTETWLTGSIGSSMRMYAANGALPHDQLVRRVEVPSGFSLFPGEILRPPRDWLARSTRLVWLSEPARGGHFAAFEQPDVYATELRAFTRDVAAGAPGPATVPG